MLIHVFLTATVLALLGAGEAVECPSAWAKLPDVEGEGCESYFQCEDWEPKKSWCPSGQQFSFQHKECQPDEDVWCEHQIEHYWSSHSDYHGGDHHSEDGHGDHGGSSSSHSSSSGGGGSSKGSSSGSSGHGGDHHDSHTVSSSTGEHSHRSTLTRSSHSGDDWEKDNNYKYEYVPDPNYEYVYEYAYSDPWLKSQMGGSSSSSSSSSPSSSRSSSSKSSSSRSSSSKSSSSKSSSSSPSSSSSRSSSGSSSSSSSGHGKSSCSSPKVIPFPVPVSGHSLLSGLGGLGGFGNTGSFHLGNLGSYGVLGAMREAPVQHRGPKLLPIAARPKVTEARLSRQELLPEDAGDQDAGNSEAETSQDGQVQGPDSVSSVNGSRDRESQDRSNGTERAASPPPLGTPSPRQPHEEEAPNADDASRAVEGEGNTPQGEPAPTSTDAGVFEAGTGTVPDGIPPDEEPESPEDPGFVDHGPETAEEQPPTDDNSESANLRAGGSPLSDGGDASNRGDFWFQEGHGDIPTSSKEDAMTSRSRYNLRHHVIANPTRSDEIPPSPEPEGSTQLPSVPKFLG